MLYAELYLKQQNLFFHLESIVVTVFLFPSEKKIELIVKFFFRETNQIIKITIIYHNIEVS